MKFSLSSRQTSEYLQKCDEIKVMWNDRNIIFDLVEKYPGKRINLCKYYIHGSDEIDWKEIKQYYVLAKQNFLIGLSYIDDMEQAKANEIPFYYLEPIATWTDLYALKRMGASQVMIDAPLFFNMTRVAEIGLPVRATANLAVRKLLPHENGVNGPWIRPEDVEAYKPYIDTIEFARIDNKQEQALFRIYAEQKTWPGDLNLIIQDLNYPGVNRMIPPDFVERRLDCRQRCAEPHGLCRRCYTLLDLANPSLYEHLKRDK